MKYNKDLDSIQKEGLDSMKVSEIKSIVNLVLEQGNEEEIINMAKILENDDRKSIQTIHSRVCRAIEKNKLESERLVLINHYENEVRSKGYSIIGGVDEVGRGPLAGPVVAAVVIFDGETKISGIDDSKKLSHEKREQLYDIIREKALDYAIGIADNKEIDEHNILNATYLAMRRAIDNLRIKPDCILNDAVRIPGVKCHQVPIIKGDSKSISIAAASIIAKVERDRIMVEYDNIYKGYGFSSNKGYGTSEHYEGLKKYGKTKIHRDSFLKKI